MTDRLGFYLGMRETAAGLRPVFNLDVERPIVILGSPGSGKTRTLVIPNAARGKRSTLLTDPKGEVTRVVGDWLVRVLCKVMKLNPMRLQGLDSDGLNPLFGILPTADEFPERVKTVRDAVTVIAADGRGDSHFDAMGSQLIGALIAFECTKPPPVSLVGVYDKLHLPTFDGGAKKAADEVGERIGPKIDEMIAGHEYGSLYEVLRRMSDSPVPEVRQEGRRFLSFGRDSREYEGVVSSARRQVEFLSSRRIRRDMSVQKIPPFARLKEELAMVGLILPPQDMAVERAGRYARLAFGCLLEEMYRSGPSKKLGWVLALIEEAHVLGHSAELLTALSAVRGYGLQICTVWHDLGQLQRLYPKGWGSIFATAGTVLVLGPLRDKDSAEYVSFLAGQYTEAVRSVSEDQRNFSWRPSISPRERRVFSPHRLMALPPGHILCLVRGRPPFLTRGVDYTETPWASGLSSNPYDRGGEGRYAAE